MCVFLSGLGFSIQSVILKLLEEKTAFEASFVAVFYRGTIQGIVALFTVYLLLRSQTVEEQCPMFGATSRIRGILLFRSVLGFAGIAFAFLALERLPIGDCIVLVMLSPLVASFLSFLVLGEPWRKQEMGATSLSIVGAICIVKQNAIFGGESLDPLGVLFGLIASFGAGCAYTSIRVLGTTAKMPWQNICVAQALGQIVLAIPGIWLAGQDVRLIWRLSIFQASLLVICAVIGTCSQILMTLGMQREKSALGTAMRMSDVLFGFVWQSLFTQDPVHALSVVGALLVCLSVLTIVYIKSLDARVTSLAVDSRVKSDHTYTVSPMAGTATGTPFGGTSLKAERSDSPADIESPPQVGRLFKSSLIEMSSQSPTKNKGIDHTYNPVSLSEVDDDG